MPWLVREGKVLATIEVATSLRDRTRGLLGRDGIEGAILLQPAKSVHTLRMQFPIDVAFCDRDLVVLKVVTMARNRVSLPVRRAHAVIEAEAGMMQKWGVVVGDHLHVRGLEHERDDGGRPESDGATPGAPPGPPARTLDLDAPPEKPAARPPKPDAHGARLVTP
jgi:uncharacterized membrane protein (UPF0127 family)